MITPWVVFTITGHATVRIPLEEKRLCVCVCVLSGKISRQQQVQTRTTLPFHAYGFNGR